MTGDPKCPACDRTSEDDIDGEPRVEWTCMGTGAPRCARRRRPAMSGDPHCHECVVRHDGDILCTGRPGCLKGYCTTLVPQPMPNALPPSGPTVTTGGTHLTGHAPFTPIKVGASTETPPAGGAEKVSADHLLPAVADMGNPITEQDQSVTSSPAPVGEADILDRLHAVQPRSIPSSRVVIYHLCADAADEIFHLRAENARLTESNGAATRAICEWQGLTEADAQRVAEAVREAIRCRVRDRAVSTGAPALIDMAMDVLALDLAPIVAAALAKEGE